MKTLKTIFKIIAKLTVFLIAIYLCFLNALAFDEHVFDFKKPLLIDKTNEYFIYSIWFMSIPLSLLATFWVGIITLINSTSEN